MNILVYQPCHNHNLNICLHLRPNLVLLYIMMCLFYLNQLQCIIFLWVKLLIWYSLYIHTKNWLHFASSSKKKMNCHISEKFLIIFLRHFGISVCIEHCNFNMCVGYAQCLHSIKWFRSMNYDGKGGSVSLHRELLVINGWRLLLDQIIWISC